MNAFLVMARSFGLLYVLLSKKRSERPPPKVASYHGAGAVRPDYRRTG